MKKTEFQLHCESNDKDFAEIKEVLTKIKDNHLTHIADDIVELKTNFTTVKTNQEWQLKFFWVVVTAAVGSLVVGVLNLI